MGSAGYNPRGSTSIGACFSFSCWPKFSWLFFNHKFKASLSYINCQKKKKKTTTRYTLQSSNSTSETVSEKCRVKNRLLNDHGHNIIHYSPKVKDRRLEKRGLALPQNIIQTYKGRKQWCVQLLEVSWGKGGHLGYHWAHSVGLRKNCTFRKEEPQESEVTCWEVMWSEVMRESMKAVDLRIQEAKATKKQQKWHILFGQITPIKGTKDCLRLLRSFQGPSFAGLPVSRAGPQPDSS